MCRSDKSSFRLKEKCLSLGEKTEFAKKILCQLEELLLQAV